MQILTKVVLQLLSETRMHLIEVSVELCTSLSDCLFRLLHSIRVHLQLDSLFQGMRLFIASEPHMFILK